MQHRVLSISEAGSLAIHGIMLVAGGGGELVSAKSIAEELSVSEAHLSKVFHRLARAGMVTGVRGPKGGFRLARPAGEITLLEVYETIEGPLADTHCVFGESQCRLGGCVFGTLMADVTQLVRSRLAPTTLADVMPVDLHAVGTAAKIDSPSDSA